MKKIGMIGVGNMGGAILRGMIASGYVAAEDVMACLHSEEKRQALAAEIPGLTCTTDAKALAQECRMIVLAVNRRCWANCWTASRVKSMTARWCRLRPAGRWTCSPAKSPERPRRCCV